MTPDPKTRATPAPDGEATNATPDAASQTKTTGAKVGEWVTKRVDKALEVAERGVHAAHRLADVAEHALDVTERVLHATGHPAVPQPDADKVVDADPTPSGSPPADARDTRR